MTLILDVALLSATAVHAGFQLTVTTLVYPALFRSQDWDRAHTAHRRAITPVVAVVYTAVVTAAVWVLVDRPDWRAVMTFAGVALSIGATALVAAPVHDRLSQGRDAGLVRRLRVADLVRTVGAFVALCGAVLVALGG